MIRSYLILFFILVGCGRGYHDVGLDQKNEKPKVVTYSWLVDRVFSKNCNSCHNEQYYKAKGGGIPLYMYDHFIMESDSVWKEISRDSMPKEGVKLTTFEKSCVREWLDAGMPE